MKERAFKTFPKERKAPKPIPEGAWEAVLVAVKKELDLSPNETTGMGDGDFWIEIEDRATMKPNGACMHYYLHNIGHLTLAGLIVNSFQTVRSIMGQEGFDREQKRHLTERVANKLLESYPPKYRARFG